MVLSGFEGILAVAKVFDPLDGAVDSVADPRVERGSGVGRQQGEAIDSAGVGGPEGGSHERP